MKKYYLLLIFILGGYSINAQVGINTEDPKATLHVVQRTDVTLPDGIIPPRLTGNALEAKSAAYGTDQNGAVVYVTAPVTTAGPKTLGVLTTGIFVYDAMANNGTGTGTWKKIMMDDSGSGVSGDGTYALKAAGNVTLLSLGINLLGSNVNYFPLTNTSTSTYTVGISSTSFITTGTGSGYYQVPSTGIYQINYSFRTGQGVSAELLSGTVPGLVITKTVGDPVTGTTTLLDSRPFGSVTLLNLGSIIGVGLVVANVTLTQGQISHIYQLTAGDKLRFGIVQGGLNLGLITDKSAELSIFKVK